MRKKKQQPVFINFSEVSPFIESDTEIHKKTLIDRIAGRVNYSLFQTMKILQFWVIGKDKDGKLYIV